VSPPLTREESLREIVPGYEPAGYDDLYCPHGNPKGSHCFMCPPDPPRTARAGRAAPAESAADRFEASLLTSGQISDLAPPEWLISDYLAKDSLAMLYGPSGSCKTFLALCWAQHIASGLWWHGHEVHPGPVFYVIAEGARGVGRRLAAWNEHYADRLRISEADAWPITWCPQAVNLADPLDVQPLLEALVRRDDRGENPALIVVDTLARSTLGADENSAKDMGLVVSMLDAIRRVSDACVLVVHHTGKDATNGARGSSTLRAAMDTELEITAVDHRLILKVTKQKDGDEGRPLRLDRISIGQSCVLLPGGTTLEGGELGPGPLSSLEALRSVLVPGGVATTVWQESAEVARRAFYTHRSLLVSRGLVVNIGTERSPRYIPADTIEGDD
jgi:hypothetical protein